VSIASFLNDIATKWQTVWEENKVYEANPSEKPKKFITVAFPYTNSPLHIGHGRTYITADIYARYLRMKGYNVLLPFAFQFTGTPILSIADAIKRGDEDIISTFINIYGISKEEVEKFTDPSYLAEYFKNDMKNTAKTLGLSVDWRREFTTIDPAFEKFIQWQYKRLYELGYLKVERAPVAYCPVDQFPVGMHDTKGDIEPEIEDIDVIYFDSGDLIFPAATPRPETVFGAIALLVNPSSEYIVVKDERGKRLVLSLPAYNKLKYQLKLTEETKINVGELLKYKVRNPVTGKEMRVLPSKYVEPKQGTGVVMAVPSHEPLHYLSLTELKESFELIPVIRTDEYGELPGPEVVSLAQTKNPQELKDYIDTLYRIEYHKGVIREDVVDLVPDFIKQFVKEKIAGKSVMEARKGVIELLENLGSHSTIYEISNSPVYCRCGAEVVVKIIDSQWFINYSNPIWKSSTLKALEKINFIPPDAKKEMEKIVFNLQPRAFTRSRGLGVRLPWDDKEIIDSLSDSTIYTAFYTISHKIKFPIISDKLLDYVFLGRGNPEEISKELGLSREQVEDLRKEFTYWYPVDSRHSGRDLIQNHLPYYVYHHIAIFGEALIPKQIVVNGFIRVGGKKMSKSFGNIYPLNKAIREYGVDTVRLALTSTASISDDIEFNPTIAKSIAEQLKHIHDYVNGLLSVNGVNEVRVEDLWLSSIMARYVKIVDEALEKFDLRTAYITTYYTIYETLKDYMELTNGKPNNEIIRQVLNVWIRLMAPFTPHLAEELWHKLNNSLVVQQQFPKSDELKGDDRSLISIEYLRLLVSYINDISNLTSKEPEKVIIYVNQDEEIKKMLKEAINAIKNRVTLRDFIMKIGNENLGKRLYELAMSLPDLIKELYVNTDFDEKDVIIDHIQFLMNKLNVTEIAVYDYNDPSVPDIKGKKTVSLPLSPGIALL
jgi:leucyl-tRNA synthetase